MWGRKVHVCVIARYFITTSRFMKWIHRRTPDKIEFSDVTMRGLYKRFFLVFFICFVFLDEGVVIDITMYCQTKSEKGEVLC